MPEILILPQISYNEEKAIDAATCLMRSDTVGNDKKETVYQQLINTLPPEDPFWPRWVMYEEKQNRLL